MHSQIYRRYAVWLVTIVHETIIVRAHLDRTKIHLNPGDWIAVGPASLRAINEQIVLDYFIALNKGSQEQSLPVFFLRRWISLN